RVIIEVIINCREEFYLKKIIRLILIVFLIMSNIFISPVFDKETDETSLDKRVNLYLPESTDDLTIYEDEGLEDELTRVKNNSRAVLLEELDAEMVSLVEIETSNNE